MTGARESFFSTVISVFALYCDRSFPFVDETRHVFGGNSIDVQEWWPHETRRNGAKMVVEDVLEFSNFFVFRRFFRFRAVRVGFIFLFERAGFDRRRITTPF